MKEVSGVTRIRADILSKKTIDFLYDLIRIFEARYPNGYPNRNKPLVNPVYSAYVPN